MSEDAGYGDPAQDAYSAYSTDTETSNDLYAASSAAQEAGDSFGSYLLNADSIDVAAQANDEWQDYNTAGDSAETSYDTGADTVDTPAAESSYDAGSSYDSGSGGDISQEYADYAGS